MGKTVPLWHNDVNRGGEDRRDLLWRPGPSELLGQTDFMLDGRAGHLHASIC